MRIPQRTTRRYKIMASFLEQLVQAQRKLPNSAGHQSHLHKHKSNNPMTMNGLTRTIAIASILMGTAIAAVAQEPLPSTESPKVIRLREKIVGIQARVASAEARVRSADSLIAAGKVLQDSTTFEVKEIEKERKIIERDHFNEIKPLERALQKAKDKETFNKTRNEIKAVETKFKTDIKAWDARYKNALKQHENGQKMSARGEENLKRARTMKKEADDALREAEKELADAIRQQQEAEAEKAKADDEKAKTDDEKAKTGATKGKTQTKGHK